MKFKSIVGFDDDAANAPEGVSMEFRVFTEDPSPIEEQNVTINLQALGFDADQECEITNMWTSNKEGSYKNAEFTTLLQNHASELYRISPQGRTQSASVQIKTQSSEADASKPFNLEIAVSGANEGWVQLFCDGKVIGTLPLNGNSSVTYVCTGLTNGEHTFKAAYSGTSQIANTESEEVKITFTNSQQGIISTTLQACAVRAAEGGIEIIATASRTVDVYRIDGAKAATAKVCPGINKVSLPVGLYIVMGTKIQVI